MVEFDLIAHTNDSTYIRDFRRVSQPPESRATGLFILMQISTLYSSIASDDWLFVVWGGHIVNKNRFLSAWSD